MRLPYRTPERPIPPRDSELEITLEMVEAGTEALCRFFCDPPDHPEKVVLAVFSAMMPGAWLAQDE